MDQIKTITLTLPDGTELEVEEPTPEQLFVFSLSTGEPSEVGGAVMRLLEETLEPDQYREIVRRLTLRRSNPQRLSIEDITGLLNQLVEGVSDFPTEPDSGSSPTDKPTGPRSTGRVRSAVSTRENSARVAS